MTLRRESSETGSTTSTNCTVSVMSIPVVFYEMDVLSLAFLGRRPYDSAPALTASKPLTARSGLAAGEETH